MAKCHEPTLQTPHNATAQLLVSIARPAAPKTGLLLVQLAQNSSRRCV